VVCKNRQGTVTCKQVSHALVDKRRECDGLYGGEKVLHRVAAERPKSVIARGSFVRLELVRVAFMEIALLFAELI
jgi:hypothetical protein